MSVAILRIKVINLCYELTKWRHFFKRVQKNTPKQKLNWTNVDPSLDTNFRLSETKCRRTVKMITMYCVGTTPVSNVVLILATTIFSTIAVNISNILVI